MASTGGTDVLQALAAMLQQVTHGWIALHGSEQTYEMAGRPARPLLARRRCRRRLPLLPPDAAAPHPPPCAPSCSPCQLEEAQGGTDPEARARLEDLRRQLGALEEAQERAAHHEAHPHHRPLQELPGGSPQGGGNSPPSDPAAMLQQMDG